MRSPTIDAAKASDAIDRENPFAHETERQRRLEVDDAAERPRLYGELGAVGRIVQLHDDGIGPEHLPARRDHLASLWIDHQLDIVSAGGDHGALVTADGHELRN